MNKTHRGKGLTDAQTGMILVIPGLAVFLTIIMYPFINSVLMSFTDRTLLKADADYIGIANYSKVFLDPYFLETIKTTFVFVICATIVPFTLGLIWAILLNQKFKGAEFLRGVTLVNWIIPGVSIGFLWMWIFNGEYGLLNGLLSSLNLIDKNINWLGQRGTALAVVIIARTWQMLPWYMAFLLGALQSVSLDQIEAARMDGAGNWKVFSKVILPSISSIVGVILILGTIGNLQHFDLPWVMTEGGPAHATTTLSIEVYRTAFKNWNMSKAATVGTIWAVLLALFSFIYLRQMKKSED